MTSRAFCPGHITGFFTIENEDTNPLKKGSRGVGFCTQLGAIAEVVQKNGSGIQISVNGRNEEAPVTNTALEHIKGTHQKSANISIGTQLPEGQGFGMSAAGTFAASLAFSHLLKLENTKEVALEATHRAEVHHITGLGDAAAQSIGGFVYRERPGIPPFGKIKSLDFKGDVVFCVLGEPIKTRETLTDPGKRSRIIEVGSSCIEEFVDCMTLESFFEQSWRFTKETDLASSNVRRAVDKAGKAGEASMVMLGNSIFAMGDVEELTESMKPLGTTVVTKIESRGGVRLLI